MCAGTVVEPAVAVSAGSVSVTSRSRSVAFSDSFAFSARTSTLARIGIVLRRSTTRWTWPSDFNSAARSTVTFMSTPLGRGTRKIQGATKWRLGGDFARAPQAGNIVYPMLIARRRRSHSYKRHAPTWRDAQAWRASAAKWHGCPVLAQPNRRTRPLTLAIAA